MGWLNVDDIGAPNLLTVNHVLHDLHCVFLAFLLRKYQYFYGDDPFILWSEPSKITNILNWLKLCENQYFMSEAVENQNCI